MAASGQLVSYCQLVNDGVENRDGTRLAALLTPSSLSPTQIKALTATDASRLIALTSDTITPPFHQIVALHLRGIAATENKSVTTAFKLQTDAADAMLEFISAEKETNWFLQPVNVLCGVLRRAAYQADDELERKGEKAKHCVEAQQTLTRFFQKMIIDRSPVLEVSKKLGCLFVTVHLFKIYFRINLLRLCTNLVNVVNNQNFPSFDLFPRSQTVAYNYYLGRLSIFEEQYQKADECLEYAFTHCHKRSVNNKRRVLQFLIPVRLLLGKLPNPKLLTKYKLTQFAGLMDAMKTGNLKKFNDNLEANQEFFIKKGVYLLLEKLKTFVYRNLFRKVYKYCYATLPEKTRNQIPLSYLQAAMRVYGADMETDELECVLANLIFDGSIKGYIAHKRCLVVSKANPFPAKGA